MPAARSRGETLPKPRPDAYVGLLGLSLAALFTALIFAYLNWDGIKEKPKPVQMPAGGAARAPATPGTGTAPGAMPPGGAPGAVPPGGAPANVPPPPQNK
jgi:hypothetical protein